MSLKDKTIVESLSDTSSMNIAEFYHSKYGNVRQVYTSKMNLGNSFTIENLIDDLSDNSIDKEIITGLGEFDIRSKTKSIDMTIGNIESGLNKSFLPDTVSIMNRLLTLSNTYVNKINEKFFDSILVGKGDLSPVEKFAHATTINSILIINTLNIVMKHIDEPMLLKLDFDSCPPFINDEYMLKNVIYSLRILGVNAHKVKDKENEEVVYIYLEDCRDSQSFLENIGNLCTYSLGIVTCKLLDEDNPIKRYTLDFNGIYKSIDGFVYREKFKFIYGQLSTIFKSAVNMDNALKVSLNNEIKDVKYFIETVDSIVKMWFELKIELGLFDKEFNFDFLPTDMILYEMDVIDSNSLFRDIKRCYENVNSKDFWDTNEGLNLINNMNSIVNKLYNIIKRDYKETHLKFMNLKECIYE